MCDDYRATTRLRALQLDTARRKLSATQKKVLEATDLVEIGRLQELGAMWKAQVDLYEAEETRKAQDVADGQCTEDEWERLYAMRVQLARRDPFEVSREALVTAAENLALIEVWARPITTTNPAFVAHVQTVRDAAADDLVALATQLTITAGKKK